MTYFFILIFLFALEIVYFKVAERFNIIDKPNERSSHDSITLRGGGLIFYFGALIFFVLSRFQYPWFYLGLTLMMVISFLDDLFSLSNKIRLLVHFSSVLLMAYQLEVFSLPWYCLGVTFIVVVGVLNAYNFMDGINGITACYSFAVGGLLMLVNKEVNFIAQDFLIYSLLAVIVFSFFNFRTKAKCFAGDVGAVTIAFILLFALGALIIQTGNFIYVLFLSVYGTDVIWTIIQRFYRKENIFKAHRSHLYQYLGNEARVNKLLVAFLYGITQFVIGYLVILFSKENVKSQLILATTILGSLSIVYLVLKSYIIKKFLLK